MQNKKKNLKIISTLLTGMVLLTTLFSVLIPLKLISNNNTNVSEGKVPLPDFVDNLSITRNQATPREEYIFSLSFTITNSYIPPDEVVTEQPLIYVNWNPSDPNSNFVYLFGVIVGEQFIINFNYTQYAIVGTPVTINPLMHIDPFYNQYLDYDLPEVILDGYLSPSVRDLEIDYLGFSILTFSFIYTQNDETNTDVFYQLNDESWVTISATPDDGTGIRTIVDITNLPMTIQPFTYTLYLNIMQTRIESISISFTPPMISIVQFTQSTSSATANGVFQNSPTSTIQRTDIRYSIYSTSDPIPTNPNDWNIITNWFSESEFELDFQLPLVNGDYFISFAPIQNLEDTNIGTRFQFSSQRVTIISSLNFTNIGFTQGTINFNYFQNQTSQNFIFYQVNNANWIRLDNVNDGANTINVENLIPGQEYRVSLSVNPTGESPITNSFRTSSLDLISIAPPMDGLIEVDYIWAQNSSTNINQLQYSIYQQPLNPGPWFDITPDPISGENSSFSFAQPSNSGNFFLAFSYKSNNFDYVEVSNFVNLRYGIYENISFTQVGFNTMSIEYDYDSNGSGSNDGFYRINSGLWIPITSQDGVVNTLDIEGLTPGSTNTITFTANNSISGIEFSENFQTSNVVVNDILYTATTIEIDYTWTSGNSLYLGSSLNYSIYQDNGTGSVPGPWTPVSPIPISGVGQTLIVPLPLSGSYFLSFSYQQNLNDWVGRFPINSARMPIIDSLTAISIGFEQATISYFYDSNQTGIENAFYKVNTLGQLGQWQEIIPTNDGGLNTFTISNLIPGLNYTIFLNNFSSENDALSVNFTMSNLRIFEYVMTQTSFNVLNYIWYENDATFSSNTLQFSYYPVTTTPTTWTLLTNVVDGVSNSFTFPLPDPFEEKYQISFSYSGNVVDFFEVLIINPLPVPIIDLTTDGFNIVNYSISTFFFDFTTIWTVELFKNNIAVEDTLRIFYGSTWAISGTYTDLEVLAEYEVRISTIFLPGGDSNNPSLLEWSQTITTGSLIFDPAVIVFATGVGGVGEITITTSIIFNQSFQTIEYNYLNENSETWNIVFHDPVIDPSQAQTFEFTFSFLTPGVYDVVLRVWNGDVRFALAPIIVF